MTRVTWLGTAAHVVTTDTTTLLIDPYVSRHGLLRLATRALTPDDDAIARWVPAKVDAVLCGHSHFDHLLDAPRIARRTGAKLVGSTTTCAFARAEGVSEDQLVEIAPGGGRVVIGDVTVRFVPSLHGRIVLGRVPFEGVVRAPPRLPARMWDYKMGGAFGLLLEAPDTTVYHNGSADLVDAALAGLHADTLLVGLAGRHATRDYLRRLTDILRPSTVIPTHHDWFFAPLGPRVRPLPGIDLDGFRSEVARLLPRARLRLPEYGEEISVGDALHHAVAETRGD